MKCNLFPSKSETFSTHVRSKTTKLHISIARLPFTVPFLSVPVADYLSFPLYSKMASRFQAGGREEPGSGGKILRGRRVLPAFSPYSRPSSAETLLPRTVRETQAGRNPSWVRGLIFGAGKLISSVLGFGGGSPQSESSSEYSSDEERDPNPIEMEDRLTGFNVRETIAEGNVKSLAIVPKSETKLVIEHLLMQETFSRDECSKLIKIIRSRVQDPSPKVGWDSLNEVLNKATGNGHWPLLNHMNLSETFNHSSSNLASFTPRIYHHGVDSYDLRKKAVMEAKKWFEEKQLSPNQLYDQERGVCILSSDMNKHGFDAGGGSPIDMAKSYMQSLPPWRSPYFSTVGFRTPQSKEHASHNIGSQMLHTSKSIEGDYIPIGSWDQESLDTDQDDARLRQVESTSRLSLFKYSKTLVKTTNIYDTGQDKPLKLHDGKAVEEDNVVETHNITSQIVNLEPKQAFKVTEEAENVTALTNTPELLHSNIGGELNTSDAMDIGGELNTSDAMDMSDKNLDLEISLLSEDQVCSISCQDSPGLASTAGLDNGDCFRESKILLHKNHPPAEASLQKESDDKGKLPANTSSQVSHDSDCKQSHSVTDSKKPDENSNDQEEATASSLKVNTNRLLSEVNINSDLESMNKADPTATNSSKSGAPSIISEGTHEPPSDVSSDIPGTHRIANTSSRPRKGMKTRSMEQVPKLPEPSRRSNRRMKKLVRPKKMTGQTGM
ncbi:hypothetical protein AXF42_Ash018555 [Apostasia shenzhenica]|uniref:Protein KAKU4 n=1 Tax=Apostasia shenzhenica TaxID=1088818 RepID=A0A2I0APV0_9ASPA|nr:hypothetical protein AXF42_Ash018555 [Apostasia shenzhenica]